MAAERLADGIAANFIKISAEDIADGTAVNLEKRSAPLLLHYVSLDAVIDVIADIADAVARDG